MIWLYKSYENGETLLTISHKKGGKFKFFLGRRSPQGIVYTIREKLLSSYEQAEKEFRLEYEKIKKGEYKYELD